ncbi:MAG: 6-phospho-beta-glucosidase [Chloroflexota bacterium]|nr:6-phospho-beta-glucosidase [Chloroflexota bacterium]
MLKVAVIGGGSTYTPELINGFIERQEQFPLDQLWLMDIDKERLHIVGQFARRMAKSKHAQFEIILSDNQGEAIENASYVITQLRVGQMKARREDEYLGKRHNLIGQETTGIGGMAKALRTIPVILSIAEDMVKFAPAALLVNFANPSGLVTEALFRYAPEITSVGVCNAALTTKMEILKNLNARLGTNFSSSEANIKTLGLNHLTWYYGLEIQGQDYWPQIMAALVREMRNQDDPYFDPNTLEHLQMLPNSYLRYYYYTHKMLEQQDDWPPSRAEEVFDIETDLLKSYKDKRLSEPPKDLMKRGGAYYSTVATQLLNAHYNDLDEVHVVNTRNNGAVPSWNKDWVLEMPCRINAKGVFPMPTPALTLECESLINTLKAYEILTAKAAVEGDRDAAYKALLVHPLGPAADKITMVLNDMLEINQQYLPKFFKE